MSPEGRVVEWLQRFLGLDAESRMRAMAAPEIPVNHPDNAVAVPVPVRIGRCDRCGGRGYSVWEHADQGKLTFCYECDRRRAMLLTEAGWTQIIVLTPA